jgi:hypothetical protein
VKNTKKGVLRCGTFGGDALENLDGVRTLEVALLSLDEPSLEAALFTNDVGEVGDDIDNLILF